MLKLVIFFLICCVGDILSIKDIPNLKAKVGDAITNKKSLILEQQELRRKKKTENIDLFIDRVMEYFVNRSKRTYVNQFGYIGAYSCYQDLIENNEFYRYDQHPVKSFIGVFDFEDLLELLEILTKKKFLTKLSPKYRRFADMNPVWLDRGPYFKLTNK